MSLRGLNISRMDTLIQIESVTVSKDSNGGDVRTWAQYKSCYAERVRKPGGESIQSNQQVAQQQSEYRVRYDAGLDETMRLYEGRLSGSPDYLYIRDVQHWRREGYSLIIAERRDNA